MKNRLQTLATILTALFVFPFGSNGNSFKIEPVSSFDLNRYLGKWYEIARLPTWFEKDLINVTATYSLNKNGKVKVQNEGNKNGIIKKAIGKAKIAKNLNVGYLKVSFFGPFYADYKIIVLDTSYQYAMVASSAKYLWILSRDPKMNEEVLKELVGKADKLGFKTNQLIYTKQQ